MRNPELTPILRCAMVCSALVVVGCSPADDFVYRDDSVGPATTVAGSVGDDVLVVPTEPNGSVPVLPDENPVGEQPVVFDRLWSPLNAIAEVNGRGATPADLITIDDRLADVRQLSIEEDGTFVAQISVPEEGSHTVCVRDVCGRVFVLGVDAESSAEVEAKIAEALPIAREAFDLAAELPGWTIEVGGPFAGLGGSTNVAAKTVVVYANRERSVDDFVRTLLHEFGHAVDDERLVDADRAIFLELRGMQPDTPWRIDDDHSIEAWANQPAEDFAEVLAAVWTDGALVPRTADLALPPDAATLAAVASLADV